MGSQSSILFSFRNTGFPFPVFYVGEAGFTFVGSMLIFFEQKLFFNRIAVVAFFH